MLDFSGLCLQRLAVDRHNLGARYVRIVTVPSCERQTAKKGMAGDEQVVRRWRPPHPPEADMEFTSELSHRGSERVHIDRGEEVVGPSSRYLSRLWKLPLADSRILRATVSRGMTFRAELLAKRRPAVPPAKAVPANVARPKATGLPADLESRMAEFLADPIVKQGEID
jgi:hypothetical protein